MEMTVGAYRFSVERVPLSRAELVQRYDVIASRWQGLIHRLGFTDAYRGLFEIVQRRGYLAGVTASAQLLDVGVGTGALSVALQETLDTKLNVNGIDLSPGMIDVAQTALPNGRFQVAEATILPFASNQFDVVLCAHVLEHLPDPEKGLSEIARVAKPGRTIVLIMTCSGIWGRWIRHKWGTQLTDHRQLLRWIERHGFQAGEIIPLRQKGKGWQTSLALVAQMPSE